MRPGASRGGLAAVLVAALASVSASQFWLERHPLPRDPAGSLLYLPNGRFLRVASMGYPTFLADLIYLWSIQYYGTYREADRFLFLDHVYGNVIARLDPRYVDPYLIGSLIMVVEKGDLESGLRLLEQGMEANPKEWILPYEAGFYAYDMGKDYTRAATYFERAMHIPGAPPSVWRLRAEMFNKKGDKVMSLQLWREVLESATDDRVTAIAANHVHDLTLDVDINLLQEGVSAYRQRQGRYPSSLVSLVTDGLLRDIPTDPDGNPYQYDPQTGQVKALASFRLRR